MAVFVYLSVYWVTLENRSVEHRDMSVSELIRLLSKDTGGSRHYTGWGKTLLLIIAGRCGLQTLSEWVWEEETKRTRERESEQ